MLQRSSGRGCGHFVHLIRSHSSKPPLTDHYGVLGIRRDAKQKDVKDAFYKLSKIYHPDVNRDNVALQKFQDITAAYETLGTAESRDAYDMATQPVRNQRLSSAAPKQRNDPDDYTLSYKMRKKAHEKIRIKTHPESGSSGQQQRSPPGHHSAGSFDPNIMEDLYRDFRSPGFLKANFEAEERASDKNGLIFLFFLFAAGLMSILRMTSEDKLPKGFRLRVESDNKKKE